MEKILLHLRNSVPLFLQAVFLLPQYRYHRKLTLHNQVSSLLPYAEIRFFRDGRWFSEKFRDFQRGRPESAFADAGKF